ncbi:MAG TPA: hypothetical protein VFC79_12700, partial [Tissierellaceae bacterium]|nr:hypothetical protein [Tissierellaceae bacterium]
DPVGLDMAEAFYNKIQKDGFEGFKTIKEIDEAAKLSPEELINASTGRYNGDLELNPTGTRDIKYGPETGMRTIDGNVKIVGNLTGTIDLRNLTITGDLTVETPNATVNNSAIVEGTITIINVSDSTWNENISGNRIVVNGITIYIAPGTVVESLVLNEGTTLIVGDGVPFTNPVVVNGNATIISTDTFLVVIGDGVKVVFKDDQEDEGTEIVGNESEEVDIKVQVAIVEYKAALAAVAEEDYTPESWSEYQDIVKENLVTEENTQTEIDEAKAAIEAAQENLVTKIQAAVADAEEAIAALPKVEDVKIADKEDVAAAKVLVEVVRELDKDAEVEGEELIAQLEARIAELEEVKRVVEMINALPLAKDITLENKEQVVAARDAYDGLTDTQKESVEAENYQKLINNENKIIFLERELALIPAVNSASSTEDMEAALQAIVDAKLFTLTNLSDPVAIDEANEVLYKKQESGFEGFKTIEEIDEAATL